MENHYLHYLLRYYSKIKPQKDKANHFSIFLWLYLFTLFTLFKKKKHYSTMTIKWRATRVSGHLAGGSSSKKGRFTTENPRSSHGEFTTEKWWIKIGNFRTSHVWLPRVFADICIYTIYISWYIIVYDQYTWSTLEMSKKEWNRRCATVTADHLTSGMVILRGD